jgi:hypothetical protein
VQYRFDAALGVLVPAVTASYAKFRRFQVTTEEKISIPKDRRRRIRPGARPGAP